MRTIYVQGTGAAGTYTTTTAEGIHIADFSKAASQTITSNYGIYLDARTVGGTNNYGIYVNAPSGGSGVNAAAYFGGDVGIGTTGPTINLAVGDTDTGLKWISDGIITMYGNNQELVRFDGDGTQGIYFNYNVGIGDTSPAAALTVGNGDVFQVASTGIITNSPTTTGTLLDYNLETEWTTGTILNADYASATTLTGGVTGIALNLNNSVTPAAGTDITGVTLRTPALTQTTAVTSNYTGYQIPAAGALVQNTAGGVINWRGLDIQMPNITQTTGTVTSTGIRVLGGTVTSGTSYGLIIDSNAGNVGIGTTGPIASLNIQGTNPAQEGASTNPAGISFGVQSGVHPRISLDNGAGAANVAGNQWNIDNLQSNGSLRIFTAGSIKMTISSAGAVAIADLNASSGEVTICSTTTALVKRSAACTGSDLPEFYPVTEGVEPADVVVLTDIPNSVQDAYSPYLAAKSQKTYDSHILGVMSSINEVEAPGEGQRKAAHYHLLALAGRVPVKVSTENGPIAVGDPLTSSSTPGVAMKATKAGPIIGKAMEPFDSAQGGQGRIMVFVNVSWYDPDVYLTSTGELNIIFQPSNHLTIQQSESEDSSMAKWPNGYMVKNTTGEIINRIGSFAELVIAKLQAGLIQVKELIAERITSKIVRAEQLELVDHTTKEIYCLTVDNGEFKKVKGECDKGDQLTSEPVSPASPTVSQSTSEPNNESSPSPSSPPAGGPASPSATLEVGGIATESAALEPQPSESPQPSPSLEPTIQPSPTPEGIQ
ncbi:hypothetical protein HYV21_00035 [Candidatus Microgenomates bacterium]|nr:hypothetical protein [Candidatus Microgenomates bacterium]